MNNLIMRFLESKNHRPVSDLSVTKTWIALVSWVAAVGVGILALYLLSWATAGRVPSFETVLTRTFYHLDIEHITLAVFVFFVFPVLGVATWLRVLISLGWLVEKETGKDE